MIHDIRAVMRHEWKGFFRYAESKRAGWGGWVRWFALAILGMTIARTLGRDFGSSWATIPAVAFVAIVFIPAIVADSFAGERERHTLETLLASRISDAALLLGKYSANVLYGMLAAFLMITVGVAVAYYYHGSEPGFAIRPAILAASAVTALLGAGCMTGIGVLVSLRAPTVRRATETITIILIGLTLIPTVLIELPLPDWVREFAAGIFALPPEGPGVREFLIVACILLLVNATLLGIALARFRRARLIV